ncbi:diphthine synthase [Candidatus Woesearchaeota archaeon]|nr:diphthine synthase [Candidatus Woesearchaeota archaeon]
MTLYFIGLGLGDEKDITLKGLELIKKADKVYLEEYTSKLVRCSREDLERFYGRKIISADRDLVENKAEKTILKDAKQKDVAFLIIGDPFSATTHLDLKLRADSLGIKTIVIANTSIINAVGITGVDLYRFGRITTIPFDNKNIRSPYDVIKNNLKNKLHTLVLLDLEPANNRYMKVSQALEYLLKRGLSKNQLCVGCAGIGGQDPIIKAGKAEDLLKKRFTGYPQCLIVASKLHFMEEEALKKYS